MPLEYEAPRLTPEQRDRVLELAARLQAQEDGTIAVDDLARAAEEAGIAPRFVQQAVQTLAQPVMAPPTSTLSPDRSVAFSLVGALALVNALLTLSSFGQIATTSLGLGPVFLAGLAAGWAAKARLPFWAVPASILATLFGTGGFWTLTGASATWTNGVTVMMAVELGIALIVGPIAILAVRKQARRAR